MINFFKGIIHDYTCPIDPNAKGLNNIPNFVIRYSIFMSWNASLQLVADIIIEAILLSGLVYFYIPFRIEFFFLTIISAVIAYFTMKGMRQGSLDVTKNTLATGLVVEIALVISDIVLLLNTDKYLLETALVRIPFILLTLANVSIITFFLWLRHITKKSRPAFKF